MSTLAAALLFLLWRNVSAKNCRVDDSIDWEDPNNLYTCPADQDCCTEEAKPTCCGSMDEHEEIMRQLKLWGGVIGVILLFGLLMWYARWDGQCCDEDTKCCGCCRKDTRVPQKQRAQNMGPPPGFGGAKPRNSDSAANLLSNEQMA